jgi:hypothetical protein
MSDVLKGVEWAAEATEEEEAAEKKKGKKSTYKVFRVTLNRFSNMSGFHCKHVSWWWKFQDPRYGSQRCG